MIRKLFAFGCLIATLAAAAPLSPRERQLNLDSFEYVWTAVRDKHWEVKPGGLDWKAVHDEFRPAIEKAETTEQARKVITDMLARLHQTHFGIIPADAYSKLDEGGASDGVTGLDLRVVGSQILVTSVDPGTPAASSGVHPGWVITKIRDADAAPLVAKLSEPYRDSTLREIALRRALLGRINGQPGESVDIEFLDGADQRVQKKLALVPPKGAVTRLGFLGPQHVWFDFNKLAGVGYFRFNMFLDPGKLMPAFSDDVQSCMKCDGFVIDLRGNPGGIGVMAMGMAGWFVDKSGERLGTMYMRDTTLKFVVNPRAQTFAGPVAILVDGASASTSEIFAEGMQDLHRARVFGTRTAAAALPSVIEKLPNGDGFQYAIANYISEGGQPLEGRGVIPDVEAPPTRAALLAGKDPALDAAIQWIESKKANP
jgi:carboxyl-terminal processing protease